MRLYYLDNLRTFLIFLVVLVHAGVVYESSGFMAPYWIVDDPSTSDLPGLVNLLLDLLVMPTIFFISGYFTPSSLERKGTRRFLETRLRRLMLPWLVAVFTLIPLYNMIFLYSRGLPQEGWTSYFHFTNGVISMSWLWFLPVLFLFNLLYLLMRKVNLPTRKLTLGWAVTVVFVLSLGYCEALAELGWLGWTKTPLIDFQNERLLPYFLIFVLGAACRHRGVLESGKRNMKLFVAVCSTAWIPVNVYTIVLLNYFLRPGKPIVSELVDGMLFWFASIVSILALLYCAVTTFKYWLNRPTRIGHVLSGLSYGTYVLHVAVMGPVALALLRFDLPALVKYPILALATWAISTLLVLAYRFVRARLFEVPAPVGPRHARDAPA